MITHVFVLGINTKRRLSQMQKSITLTKNFKRIVEAPQGHYYLNVLPKVNGDYTEFVGCLLDHKPTKADEDTVIANYIEQEKRLLAIHVTAYDVSPEVNSFFVNDKQTWLTQSQRVGLKNSIQDEKTIGRTETTIYFDGVPYVIDIDKALSILVEIEMYAKACFITTEQHKAEVDAIETPEDLDAFDLTAGYPEKLSFSLNAKED